LGTAGTEQTLLKKLQDAGTTARATLKAYRISLVSLFCNIHTHNGYYKQRIHVIILYILSAAILPNIIKISQHSTE